MERYQKILIVNIRYNLLPFLIMCGIMILAAPVFMGIHNLNQQQVARAIEIYLSLIGIILLIPTFIPEINYDIRDLIRSKRESMRILYTIRTLEGAGFIAFMGIVFLLLLYTGNCTFSWRMMLYSLMANSIFLGGLGILMYSISDQIVFAYMIPLVYYVVNFGAGPEKLGNFYLFSMQMGSINEKHFLIGSGILFIFIGIWLMQWKMERKKH